MNGNCNFSSLFSKTFFRSKSFFKLFLGGARKIATTKYCKCGGEENSNGENNLISIWYQGARWEVFVAFSQNLIAAHPILSSEIR